MREETWVVEFFYFILIDAFSFALFNNLILEGEGIEIFWERGVKG